MKMREPEVRSGKMWACLTESKGDGKFNVKVWVDVMVQPLGRVMVMRWAAGVVDELCVQHIRKLPFAPVSVMVCGSNFGWQGGLTI